MALKGLRWLFVSWSMALVSKNAEHVFFHCREYLGNDLVARPMICVPHGAAWTSGRRIVVASAVVSRPPTGGSCNQPVDYFAAKLAELFESAGVVVRQFVVV